MGTTPRLASTPAARRSRTLSRFAWPLLFVLGTAWVASRVLLPLSAAQWEADPPFWHVGFLVYGAVGALVVSRRPDNRTGWLFLGVGVFDIFSAIVRAVAVSGGQPGFVSPTVVDVAAWLQAWTWAPSMGSLVLLVWLFPSGDLPPGRWRWAVWAAIGAVGILVVPTPILLWPLRGPVLLTDNALPGLANVLPAVAFGILAASLAAAFVALAFRLRRARGDERQQLKWVVYGGLGMVSVMLIDILVLDALGVADSLLRELFNAVAFLLVPVAAAVAIFKHRLYDIDRVINRTVVYSSVTVVLALCYIGVVSAARAITEPLTGDTAVAVAASTLVVAGLFQPVRRRIQSSVDRRFNRAQYDAAATIATFSVRLRDEVDIESLHAELIGIVSTTMQPTATALWLREATL